MRLREVIDRTDLPKHIINKIELARNNQLNGDQVLVLMNQIRSYSELQNSEEIIRLTQILEKQIELMGPNGEKVFLIDGKKVKLTTPEIEKCTVKF